MVLNQLNQPMFDSTLFFKVDQFSLCQIFHFLRNIQALLNDYNLLAKIKADDLLKKS